MAMNQLGLGLSAARHHEASLSVKEAELSLRRRLGDSERNILVVQGNLTNTYHKLGRFEEALSMERDIYSGRLKLLGEEHLQTLSAAANYAMTLKDLERFEEAKELFRKTLPVARRVLGETNILTLRMPWSYARALYLDASATLDDLREAVETLESVTRVWTRVFGEAHPETPRVQESLKQARAALAARAAASSSGAA